MNRRVRKPDEVGTIHGVAASGRALHRRRGWALVEAIIALGLLSMVATILALTQSDAGRFNAVQLARQRCIAAAQAQLDSISAGGRELPPGEVARLWPGLKTGVSRSPGQGQWQGLTLVRVQADGVARDRPVSVVLARYVR
jgi:type II secretory pathway pseudopilin PulG